jgi:DNA-nicking Smr family endonuclease
MKTCTKCNVEKSLENFVKSKRQKDGYHYICKECHKIYKENNKDTINQKHKIWLNNNKEYISNYNKQYHTQYPEKKKYYLNKWKEANPNYGKEYKHKKYTTDVNYRIKDNLRSRFYNAVINHFKIQSVIDLLGCSINELKQHLENQFKTEMNWGNHGTIWEIDHIIPCSGFDLTDLNQQNQCFHYTNLQPLFKTTHIAKSFGYNDIGNRNKSNKI